MRPASGGSAGDAFLQRCRISTAGSAFATIDGDRPAKFGPNGSARQRRINFGVASTMPRRAPIAVLTRKLRPLAVALVLAGVGLPGLAQAQGFPFGPFGLQSEGLESDEALLGVIETPPDRLVPRSPPADADLRSSDEIFASAMEELKAGRFEPAQRLFEIFVARDPGHPASGEARRHLSELYQAGWKTAAVPAAVPEALPPRPEARRVVLLTSIGGRTEDDFMLEAGDRVFFAARSAELGSRARTVLAAQARWLKRNPQLSAVIEGHADDPPLDTQELVWLATERAEAVYKRLLEEGVGAERLAIAPLGRSRPVAMCQSSDCAAQNRRAVTVLTPLRVSELPPQETGAIGPVR